MEAIIPTEIGMSTLRTEVPEKANAEAIVKDLDMKEELCEATVVRIMLYQQRMTNLYNMCIKPRTFQVRDMVLRRVFENTTESANKKFQLNRERPYTVVRVGAVGSYALNKPNETPMPRMWNAMHLKRYYQ